MTTPFELTSRFDWRQRHSTVTFIVGSPTFSSISLDRSKNRNINRHLRLAATSQTAKIRVEKGFNHRLRCRHVDIFASRAKMFDLKPSPCISIPKVLGVRISEKNEPATLNVDVPTFFIISLIF